MTITELNKLRQKYKIIEITADFINPSYNISRAKHLDTARYIICTLTENGIPRNVKENETARIRLQKPDKTYVYNDCDILEDGRILITLTEQILSVEGNAVCDIQLTDEETQVIYSTKNFIINIDCTAVNNSIIESSDEFGALNSLISTNKKLNTELQTNENIRKENENTRISSENIRKSNEETRKSIESQRVNAENTRITSENTRISHENIRITNETNRQADTALAISNSEKATQKANNAADDLQNKLDSNHFVLTEDKGIAGGVPELASDGKIPLIRLHDATLTSKGITKLTDSVTSTSTTTAATAKSVKNAYDKAVSASADLQAHNSSSAAHDDIRTLITGLTSRLNALADSDDTTLDQLSEIVAYIKNNKSLIDNITTSKVNVSDITDSLISTSADKPLSAKQGKVLNELISALTDSLDNKVDKVSGKGLSSNDYTDEEKAKLQNIYNNTDNKYLQLTGGTIDGDTTIKNNQIDILTLTRKDTSNGAAIKYQNNANVLGYLGFDGSGNPSVWQGATPTVSTMCTLLHDKNYMNYAAQKEHTHNNYLPLTGGNVSGLTSFSQGIRGYSLSSSASHGKGQNGWSHAFKITTTGVYQNQFMKFSVVQRNRMGMIYIRLVSNTTSGTVIVGEFYTIGNIKAAYVCENNVLDVYINKSEAYDEIDCIITQKGNYMNGTAITWVDTVLNSLPEGAVPALSNTTDTFNFTANSSGGTALVLDNTNSADNKTYMSFKNKGQAAGYLSMSGNDLYTYKNSSNCKVLDSKNYTSVLTDYMQVYNVRNSIKLKIPVNKTTDSDSYYSGTVDYTVKAETANSVVFLRDQLSISNECFKSYHRNTSKNADFTASLSNIQGTGYMYLTFTNNHSTSNQCIMVSFSNSSGISVESAT